MPGTRAGWSLVSVTAFALSCTTTGTGARSTGSTPMAVTTVTPPSASAPPPSPSPARAAVIARLARLNQTSQFLFGEENATLWGMYLDGAVVSTNTWFENTARAGRFTSDSAAIVGDDPAVLGVSLGMLAFEPPEWNRRTAVAAAIKRQIAEGGMVTMDWHAASCTAHAPAGEELATRERGGPRHSDPRRRRRHAVLCRGGVHAADRLARRRARVAEVPVPDRQRPAARRRRG